MKGQGLIWSQIRQISKKSGKLGSPVESPFMHRSSRKFHRGTGRLRDVLSLALRHILV